MKKVIQIGVLLSLLTTNMMAASEQNENQKQQFAYGQEIAAETILLTSEQAMKNRDEIMALKKEIVELRADISVLQESIGEHREAKQQKPKANAFIAHVKHWANLRATPYGELVTRAPKGMTVLVKDCKSYKNVSKNPWCFVPNQYGGVYVSKTKLHMIKAADLNESEIK